MKKIVATLLLVAGCFAVTFAQEPRNTDHAGKKERRADKIMKEMTASLSLTAEQQTKIKPILEETGKTMKANREKYKGNHKCMAQARFQTHKAAEEKILATLTPEQQAKFKEDKKKRMEERRKKREAELSKPIECTPD